METAKASSVLDKHIEERNAEWTERNPKGDASHYLEVVLADRAERYAAHVASMDVSPIMVMWALAMTRKYGSEYVRVYHYIADWITALLIVRYGEEPDAALSTDENYKGWPKSFTADDMQRAQQILDGSKWPADKFRLLFVAKTAEEV